MSRHDGIVQGSQPDAAPLRNSVRRRWLIVDTVSVLVVSMAFVAISVRYLLLYRSPVVLNIDEAQYLFLALSDYHALLTTGGLGWVKAVMASTIQAPLTTASATAFFLVGGASAFSALMVPVGFGLLTLIGSWMLGHCVGGRPGAWAAVAIASGAAVVVLYSREFNFAAASAATSVMALWAFSRSDQLRRWPWAMGAGLATGLFLLSRTVAVALVPGLVVAAVLVAAFSDSRRVALRNLAVAGLTATVVAGPWYIRNGSLVAQYLWSFGYRQTSEYGGRESLLRLPAG